MSCTVNPAPVSRPALEVADIVRAHGDDYRATHRLSHRQARVLWAIENCRSAALGGHAAVCDHCGAVAIAFNSCGDRHCPKCQTLARQRWVEKQCADLLPVPYFHVVFTLPHALNPLAQGNPKAIYRLLFRAASETLLEFGRNPRWLGGEIGITMVLHTWGQKLDQHIHVHCIVTGGALSSDGQRWIPSSAGFLFPVRALSRVFRAKYLEHLEHAYRDQQLRFAGSVAALIDPDAFREFIAQLRTPDWVVYAKPPFSGPEHVLAYLGRYTHRVGISNHRLIDLHNGNVRFRWRDYAHGNKNKVMTLGADEFLRRFLLHTLPSHFCRIRHYGLLANRVRRANLAQCRRLLDQPLPEPREPETAEAIMLRLTGVDIVRCRSCGEGKLRIVALIAAIKRIQAPQSTGPPS